MTNELLCEEMPWNGRKGRAADDAGGGDNLFGSSGDASI